MTYTATDDCGNISTCIFDITVNDNTPPIPDIDPLPDITDECSVSVLTAPTATDNCGGVITVTHDATLPITIQGTTVVTWTYDDGNGNTTTQTQNVIITDVTAPVPDLDPLPDITDECSVSVLTAPTATDNCGGVVTVTHDAVLPVTTQGTTVVTWTYDDGNGNITTQTQNIVIDDVTPPVPDIDPLPDIIAECSVNTLTAPTATDNCVGAVTGTHTATLPITSNTVVTWTYDDDNGNTITQTQNIVINDITAPIPDVDPLPDITDECSIATLTAPTSTDNCAGTITGTHTITLPVTTQGTTIITWTYDDGNGNITTQTQNIILADTELPVITCSSDIDQYEDTGFNYATVIVPDAVISDNCTVSTLTWTMTGTTVALSPTTGINQVGTYIFNTDTTTVSYIVTDETGNNNVCSFDVIISPPPPLSGTIISQTDVYCFGESTGSVTVSGSGGVPPYEYSIDGTNFQSSDTFNSLAAVSYTVTVRDIEMTTFDIAVTISGPVSALTVSTTQTDNICYGGTTGTATATASGGTSPYYYSWDTTPEQTTATATGLATGTYTITVTDANGCINYANVPITEPSEITISITNINVLCNGGADGTATAVVTGGTGTYTYSWDTSPVQAGATATGLAAGSYIVTVTDINGCIKTETVEITEPEALSLDATPANASCPDVADGEITLNITGGTSPYSVIWSDGITTQNRTALLPDTYNVVVTDANGCAESLNIDVGYNVSFNCIVIPDIITPNNDGYNDEWLIRNIDMYPDAEISIFTRWGRMIYHERNILSNPWDGTFKGKLVPTDSYHYILDLNDGSQTRSGVISVIREE